MPTLTITKTYADGDTLFEADLDNIKDDIENFLNVTKINDDNIQSAGITGSTKLVDASVSSAKLASGSVTTSKINDAAVTTAKIADESITAAKFPGSTIATSYLADSAVTTAKIADANVTAVKLAAPVIAVSASSGSFSSSSLTYVSVIACSSITITSGRPVLVALTLTTGNSEITTQSHSSSYSSDLEIRRDSTAIGHFRVNWDAVFNTFSFSSPTVIIDQPAAGSYVYSLYAKSGASGRVVNVLDCKLSAVQL